MHIIYTDDNEKQNIHVMNFPRMKAEDPCKTSHKLALCLKDPNAEKRILSPWL